MALRSQFQKDRRKQRLDNRERAPQRIHTYNLGFVKSILSSSIIKKQLWAKITFVSHTPEPISLSPILTHPSHTKRGVKRNSAVSCLWSGKSQSLEEALFRRILCVKKKKDHQGIEHRNLSLHIQALGSIFIRYSVLGVELPYKTNASVKRHKNLRRSSWLLSDTGSSPYNCTTTAKPWRSASLRCSENEQDQDKNETEEKKSLPKLEKN